MNQKQRHFQYLIGLLVLAGFISCASFPSRQVRSPNDRWSHNKIYEEVRLNIPRKKVANRFQKPPEYRLGIGDVLEVKFFYHPEFNETITVGPDGRVSLQRIGFLYVVDMPPSKLQVLIKKKYAEIVKDPEVTVFLREFAALKVYVLGQVQNPGGFAWQKNLTVVRAIAEVGGFTRAAKYSDILLLRLENRHLVVRKINLKEMLKGRTRQRDFRLKPNDVIHVPMRTIANVKEYVNHFYDLILPPLEIYYRAGLVQNYFRGE